MDVSHALSEEAVKRLGLDKKEAPSLDSQVVVKEWNSPREFWDDEEKKWEEENKKLSKKIKDFFVYTIGYRVCDWWYDTKWYFSNLKRFQPILKTWRSFDYHYQIDLFKFGIEQLANTIEKHENEIEESRKKRIEAMRALIAEIDRDYEEDVRKRLNYSYLDGGKVTLYKGGSVCFHDASKDKNKELKKKSDQYYKEIAKERLLHYQKIFDLILGKDDAKVAKEVKKRLDAMQDKPEYDTAEYHDLYHKVWSEVWDGSGIEGWWD